MFDQFVIAADHRGRLTQQLALDFASSATTKGGAARRYQVIRSFSAYLVAIVPGTPILDSSVMRSDEPRIPARIFTENELAELLREADRSSFRAPVRGLALWAMIGLAASCGLRPGEVIRLDKGDVDWANGVLRIMRTKFRKDRLVPLHPTTQQALGKYAERRDATFHGQHCEAFFLNARGARLASAALEGMFRDLLRRIGMRDPRGCGPSFGDLRHTFAVRRMVAWYREGVDVQAKLPVLATFMGHVEYSSTAYYITATPELQGLASERLGAWLNGPGRGRP
jgi:integrase